jgi:TrmH family RNA methyltransferase
LSRKNLEENTSLSSWLSVVLVNTRNPLNIGAAARAMSNFGFHNLRLVQPYEPSFREARSAVGAAEIMAAAREYQTVAEAVRDCTLVVGTTAADRRQLQHELKPLDRAAGAIFRQRKSGRVALLFGSEKRGLSNEDFSHCHWLLRISTREEHGSMNLGQAVAICLYELARSIPRPQAPANHRRDPKQNVTATHGALETMTTLLLELSRASGYLGRKPSVSAEEKVRRMVVRLGLSAADAELWLGILRQILWKLNAR